MPQGRPSESPNKEALNALTDLYYLYSDLATHLRASDKSPQELDLFFTRPGGLKELLHKYYLLASLDPQEAGSHTESLTLESMLPRDNGIAFYQAHDELWSQIIDVTDVLKGYNREQGAVGTPVPPEVTEVVNEGRQILARRIQRSRSGAEVATVNLSSAVVSYEDHILMIGTVPIELEGDSIMDLVTRYMVVNIAKREQVYMDVISTWIAEESHGAIGEPGGRSIKDACRAVNGLFKAALGTEEDFFDTSIRHRVTRRY